MGYSPVHLNGNLLCAVDTESTGLDASKHDMLQICVLPLGPDLRPSKEFLPFELLIRPESPETGDDEANKVNKGLMTRALTYGIDRWQAVDLLQEWFAKLKLPERKKIVPLAANYQHDRDFIREWMGGPLNYESVFRGDYRDVQETARTINDMCDWHSERIPFPKTNLAYLCTTLGVEHINKHDASGDCLATAEIYRRLMRYKDYWNPVPIPETEVYDPAIDQLIQHLERLTDPKAKRATIRQFLSRTGR